MQDNTVTTSRAPVRGLDHLVIGVHDLDAAANGYEDLGFTVGRRNSHPWGTDNRIVQFPGVFLELIAVRDAALIPPHGPPMLALDGARPQASERRVFSFGAFVRDALGVGEGVSMVALESQDAKADAAEFTAVGIGGFQPFFFERQATLSDGSAARVAFSLAFARDDAAPDCGFFAVQQHEPQNFWNSALQRHANGATGLASVAMIADNPTDHHIFLARFTGQRDLGATSSGISAALPRGRLDILTPDAAAFQFGDPALARDRRPRFAGFAVSVTDTKALGAFFRARDAAFIETPGRIVIPAAANRGAAIAFEAEAAKTAVA